MSKKILKLSKILFDIGFKKESSDLEALLEGEAPTEQSVEGEPKGKTEFSGILKLMPTNPPTQIQARLSQYFADNDLKPVPEDKLHITLLNQTILKPWAKEIKGKEIPQYTGRLIYGGIYSVKRDSENKHSVFVAINQNKDEREEIHQYVRDVLRTLEIPAGPELQRVYHISLGNKTGNPHDSVGHSEARPIELENCEEIQIS